MNDRRGSDQPGYECFTQGHFWVHFETDGRAVLSWCLWCGGGSSDPETIRDEDGEPLAGVVLTGPFLRTRQDYEKGL